jgi:hypothetical protein
MIFIVDGNSDDERSDKLQFPEESTRPDLSGTILSHTSIKPYLFQPSLMNPRNEFNSFSILPKRNSRVNELFVSLIFNFQDKVSLFGDNNE